jgi:hypothetical protein
MQAVPSPLINKSAKGNNLADTSALKNVVATEGEIDIEGKIEENSSKIDFSNLLANLTGSQNGQNLLVSQSSENGKDQIINEKGEKLKNLLQLKTQNSKIEVLSEENPSIEKESLVITDPKQMATLMAALSAKPESISTTKIVVSDEGDITQSVAKTSSNLDSLLNALKGKEESIDDDNVDNEPLKDVKNPAKTKPIKGELKSENPLEFLMNGAKTKNITENSEQPILENHEELQGQKKIMTGEEYLKNMVKSEVKDRNLMAKTLEAHGLKNQNVRGYGQVMTLATDPLIKNIKESGPGNIQSNKQVSGDEIESLKNKNTESISEIKQNIVPLIQNKENKEYKDSQAETKTQGNQKVLDLGKMNTANTTEIIKRISDYVEQNQVANKSSLDLTVKHDSLGEFKIQVSKMPTQSINQSSNFIDMQITTTSKEGQDFFIKNEVSLMKNLNNAGINLSDFRIVSSMSDSSGMGHTDSKQSNSGNSQDSHSKQFMSFESGSLSSDSSNGKGRRKELWEEYQQRYGA